VCIVSSENFFRANRLGLFQKTKEIRWQQQRESKNTGKAFADEHRPDRVAAGWESCAPALPVKEKALTRSRDRLAPNRRMPGWLWTRSMISTTKGQVTCSICSRAAVS